MFRKLILSSVLGTGLVTGLALTPTVAEAHPPVRAFHRDFEVLCRRGRGWETRGHYRDRFEAERAAEQLRCRGFFVEIRPC